MLGISDFNVIVAYLMKIINSFRINIVQKLLIYCFEKTSNIDFNISNIAYGGVLSLNTPDLDPVAPCKVFKKFESPAHLSNLHGN